MLIDDYKIRARDVSPIKEPLELFEGAKTVEEAEELISVYQYFVKGKPYEDSVDREHVLMSIGTVLGFSIDKDAIDLWSGIGAKHAALAGAELNSLSINEAALAASLVVPDQLNESFEEFVRLAVLHCALVYGIDFDLADNIESAVRSMDLKN